MARKGNEILRIDVYDRQRVKDSLGGGKDVVSALRDGIKNSVFLPINPKSISFRKDRVVSEIQTNSPGRYVVLDWGISMISIVVNATTGRLLPFSDVLRIAVGAPGTDEYNRTEEEFSAGNVLTLANILSRGNFQNMTYEDIVSLPLRLPKGDLASFVTWIAYKEFGVSTEDVLKDISGRIVDTVRKGDDITSIYELSLFRYLMLKLLEKVYEEFDADNEFMSLIWMGKRYFGYISSFEYSITAERLWIIDYSFTFKQFPKPFLGFVAEALAV